MGCEYLYLFAADKSTGQSLLKHYREQMNFGQPEDVGTNKPRFDFTCQFMCQKILDMQEKQKSFFENFN